MRSSFMFLSLKMPKLSPFTKDFTQQASAQQLDNDADLPAPSGELPEVWLTGWNAQLVLLYFLISLCGKSESL